MTHYSFKAYFPPTQAPTDLLPDALNTWREARAALDAAQVAPALAGGDSNCRRAVRALERAEKAYYRACEAVTLIVAQKVVMKKAEPDAT